MSSSFEQNNNWDLAILTAVVLLLLFFWFYKFLFITDPSENPIPLQLFTSSDGSNLQK